MPCKPSKARKLLKAGKAKIIDYKPFTIQLLYPTGKATQPTDIGIDLGAKHIGVAIQSQNQVLAKGEIELRDDIKSNLDTRRTYRRSRRYRKTRYRKPRFDSRTKPKVGYTVITAGSTTHLTGLINVSLVPILT